MSLGVDGVATVVTSLMVDVASVLTQGEHPFRSIKPRSQNDRQTASMSADAERFARLIMLLTYRLHEHRS